MVVAWAPKQTAVTPVTTVAIIRCFISLDFILMSQNVTIVTHTTYDLSVGTLTKHQVKLIKTTFENDV